MRGVLLTWPFLLLLLMAPALAQKAVPRAHEAAEIENLVDAAAEFLDRRGPGAFEEFRKPNSPWRHDDLYLFAMDLSGNVLFNAAHPHREGRNWIDERDADGKRFHRDFVDVVKRYGSGWVDYMFPKPGGTIPVVKWSYLRGVTISGTTALVGAGAYVD
ncbi:cache domain-containing protein [Methylobacterium gregans]|uniref:Single Cache domain-containing protein n=1 Tax=Methylobacterium gregans TaxID=374424 RepID=A0AA37MAV0_9HYPH|nr:cache domain-containing protein [Methylobacterium gregans]MDQ0519486.1 hypothetical protein [Methylobacterium gregans]GJD79260.1 hypothetical protein NBEOAGPD_2484 [Methylobacterium gregans]GLS52875.1 hypothetical protein GCM10007886_10580 [Methylobacterium gregans]